MSTLRNQDQNDDHRHQVVCLCIELFAFSPINPFPHLMLQHKQGLTINQSRN